MPPILVYLCQSGNQPTSHSDNQALSQLFTEPSIKKFYTLRQITSSPICDVISQSVGRPQQMVKKREIVHKVYDQERVELLKILSESLRLAPKNFILILQSNQITCLSPKSLYDYLRTAIKIFTTTTWDLCYLNKYRDRCDLYTPIPDYPFFYHTHSPFGLDALFISPIGRDRILGKRPLLKSGHLNPSAEESLNATINSTIQTANLLAITPAINLFSFNPEYISRLEDLDRFTLCRLPTPLGTSSLSTIPIYWYIGIVILVLLVGIVFCFQN